MNLREGYGLGKQTLLLLSARHCSIILGGLSSSVRCVIALTSFSKPTENGDGFKFSLSSSCLILLVILLAC